jgi:hypothetical protein
LLGHESGGRVIQLFVVEASEADCQPPIGRDLHPAVALAIKEPLGKLKSYAQHSKRPYNPLTIREYEAGNQADLTGIVHSFDTFAAIHASDLSKK